MPIACSLTSPASFRTLRCCDTAGRVTGSRAARLPTDSGPAASTRTMALRVPSPSAAQASPPRLVTTNGKLPLTNRHVNALVRTVRIQDQGSALCGGSEFRYVRIEAVALCQRPIRRVAVASLERADPAQAGQSPIRQQLAAMLDSEKNRRVLYRGVKEVAVILNAF